VNSSSGPPPVSFPPAPWHSRGTMWIGLFKALRPMNVPPALTVVSDPRNLVVMLVRHREGTLSYDELIIGTPVRRGLRVGLWSHTVWVDDTASLWGGRRIWGVPKELAKFAWDDHGVLVTGPAGATVGLTQISHSRWRLPIAVLAPAFGRIEDQLRYFTGRLRGCASAATTEITAWPDEFSPLSGEIAAKGVQVSRFRMVTGRPRRLRVRGAGHQRPER
jgi:hypothetical protein